MRALWRIANETLPSDTRRIARGGVARPRDAILRRADKALADQVHLAELVAQGLPYQPVA